MKHLKEEEIKIEDLYPNPDNPRKEFNNIDDLVISIQVHGLIYPILVVKDEHDCFMIVDGERRYRAYIKMGLASIKAKIILADKKMLQNWH